jgi:hypothetical protein
MRPALVLFALSVGLVAAADPAAVAQPKAVTIKLDKLSAPAPAGWVSEKPKYTLRSYQFQLPGEKDGPAGEFIVMPESDPKAEKVFPRWKASFVPPDGKTADDISTVRAIAGVKGAKIDVLDAAGTWKYKARPFDPKSKEELKDDYRVVWVIVADDDEASHVRLSGPRETVDKAYPALEKMLKALK